jgi:hypothetical protein
MLRERSAPRYDIGYQRAESSRIFVSLLEGGAVEKTICAIPRYRKDTKGYSSPESNPTGLQSEAGNDPGHYLSVEKR